jgi:hypothetical protein
MVVQPSRRTFSLALLPLFARGHVGWIYWNKPGLNLLPYVLLRCCGGCGNVAFVMYGHINTIGTMIGPAIVHRLRLVG